MQQSLAIDQLAETALDVGVSREYQTRLSGGLAGFALLSEGTPSAAHSVSLDRDSAVGQTAQPRPIAAPHSPLKGRITGPVRLLQSIKRAWGLNNSEVAELLAYPAPDMAELVLNGTMTFDGNPDRADRARLLYLIHDTLADLFLNTEDEQRWIRTPSPALDNVSPLSYMVEHRIPGIVAVRTVVERRLANR